jgi:hypothetical protein
MATPPDRLTIASRDLLALETTRNNLEQNGYPGAILAHHTAGLAAVAADDSVDLVTGTLNEGEGAAICCENLRRAAGRYPGVPLLVGCSSSLGSRLVPLLKKAGLQARVQTRRKGFASLLCRSAGGKRE